jgi:hypothetical protein
MLIYQIQDADDSCGGLKWLERRQVLCGIKLRGLFKTSIQVHPRKAKLKIKVLISKTLNSTRHWRIIVSERWGDCQDCWVNIKEFEQLRHLTD